MEGIIVCGAIIAAIMFFRNQAEGTEAGAFAAVRNDSDESMASAAWTSSSLPLLEHSSISSDDEWPTSSSMLCISSEEPYQFLSDSPGSDWWTDPAYASLPGNIYHDTLMDPTYTDDITSSFDDSFSSSSGYDDSLSSSSFDDSCSSSSFDDSFSSSSSFDD